MTAPKGPNFTDPNLRLVVGVGDDDKVSIWTRDGMPGEELARILREVARGFESGDITRIG